MTITIKTENSAFQDNPRLEINRLLHVIMSRMEKEGLPFTDYDWKLFDVNGNEVGSVSNLP